MIDAVDYGAYRSTGRLVISKQKFMEIFLRRFAESVTNNKTYQISFYDIYEEPPKVTVRIRTTAGASVDSETFDVTLDTVQSGILETIYGMNSYAEYTLVYDSMGESTCSPSSKTVEKGKAWGALCAPTKVNNTFKGWNTEKDGSGTTITEQSIATKSLVVYAQWDTPKVIMRFNANAPTSEVNFSSLLGDGWHLDSNGYVVKKDGSYHQMGVDYNQKVDAESRLTDYNYG